jgi:hypothetical protein
MQNLQELSGYLQRCLRPKDNTEFYEGPFDLGIFNNLKQDALMIVPSEPVPPFKEMLFYEYVRIGASFLIKKAYKNLEWLNDDGSMSFTTNAEKNNSPMYRRLLPPPDESVDHTFIIGSVIKAIPNSNEQRYIEYGVRNGSNINSISNHVKQCYGVDIQSPSSTLSNNCTMTVCTTNKFSECALPSMTFNFAFVDADHKFESAYQDFVNLYKYIQPGGIIFLHDTYPCEKRLLEPGACNDCYKTPIEIKKNYPDIELVTLPLNPGITIIRKQ